VTYPVIVEVENPDRSLRPTMTANVSIEVARVRNALRIPNAALRWRPEAKAGAASAEERAAAMGLGGGAVAAARQAGAGVRGGGGGRRGRGGPTATQTVYKLPAGKEEPAPAEVKTGISDGRVTQVVSGQVAEGDTVVTGAATLRSDAPAGAIGGSGGRGAGGGRRGF
jgi:HlyD family secretion protein